MQNLRRQDATSSCLEQRPDHPLNGRYRGIGAPCIIIRHSGSVSPPEFSRPDILRPRNPTSTRRESQQKEIDMHHSIKHLAVAILLVLGLSASTAQAQTTLVSDDFSSNALGNSNRLRVENTADEWIATTPLAGVSSCLLYTSPSPRD